MPHANVELIRLGADLKHRHVRMVQVTTSITVMVINELNFSGTGILCILQ